MYIVPIPQMSSLSTLESVTQNSGDTQASGAKLPFSEVIKDAYSNLSELSETASNDAFNLALGQTDDLHTIMINAEKAAVALELTVQLTAKALNAYNEIMRMQI